MDNNKWQPVSISKKMIERVDTFLETDAALRLGLTSRADVISMLLREFLDRMESLNNGHPGSGGQPGNNGKNA